MQGRGGGGGGGSRQCNYLMMRARYIVCSRGTSTAVLYERRRNTRQKQNEANNDEQKLREKTNKQKTRAKIKWVFAPAPAPAPSPACSARAMRPLLTLVSQGRAPRGAPTLASPLGLQVGITPCTTTNVFLAKNETYCIRARLLYKRSDIFCVLPQDSVDAAVRTERQIPFSTVGLRFFNQEVPHYCDGIGQIGQYLGVLHHLLIARLLMLFDCQPPVLDSQRGAALPLPLPPPPPPEGEGFQKSNEAYCPLGAVLRMLFSIRPTACAK